MLTEHEKFEIPDENREHPITVEVNWDAEDQRSNECKLIKFIYPDGTESLVRKEHLLAVCFAIGRQEEQRNLIPQKIRTVRKYQTMLGITATKDIKKGEKINVSVDIPLPDIEQEIISEAKRINRKGKFY